MKFDIIPSVKDRLRSIWEKPVYRRDALKILGAFAAGSVLNRVLGPSTQTPDSPTAINTAPVKDNPDRLLNPILAETPFTNQRLSLESQYVSEVLKNPTLQGIDHGLWVISDSDERKKLLVQRWELRKTGKEGLSPLPADKIAWAASHNIHPEILGIASDAYSVAQVIIDELMKKGKIRKDQIPAEDAMINDGGMAELIDYETGDLHHFSRYAFTNIGEGLAFEETNINRFPQGIEDIKRMCANASKDTGYNFIYTNVVGSIWPEKQAIMKNDKLTPDQKKETIAKLTTSGGAVANQILPPNVNMIYDVVRNNTEKGIKLNIFDPTQSVVIAWVLLAIYGYWRNHPEDIRDALWSWNQNPDQVNEVYDVAVKYYNKFLNPELVEKPYTH